MIRFKKLHIENALTIESIDIPLDNQGLVLVSGQNGAGKSAMFDTLRHVLFGNTSRGLKGKALVRSSAPEGYHATLSMDINNQKYRVLQAQSHSEHGTTLNIFKGKEHITHQKSKLKNQQQLVQVLGITQQQFDAAVSISQEAAHPLVNGTGPECAAYLSSTFGLDRFDEIIDKVKEHIKRDDKQLGEMQAHKQTVSRQQEILGHLQPADKLHATKIALDADIAANAAEHAALVAEHIRLTKQYEVQKRLETLVAAHADLAASTPAELRARLAKQRATIETLVTEISSAEKDSARQRERAALVKRIADTRSSMPDEPVPVELDLLRALKARIDKLAIKASALDRISGLAGESNCPTCGQTVDAKHIQEELAVATKAATKLTALRKELREQEAQATRVDQQARQLEKARTSLAALEEQLASMPPERAVQAPEKMRAKLGALREEVARVERWLSESERNQIDRSIDAAAIERVVTKTQAVQATKANLLADYAAVTGDIRARLAAEKVLTDAQTSLQALEDLWRENSRRKTLIKALKRLKIRRMHAIVRAIQEALPPYVSLLFGDDTRVEVDDLDPETIDRWCSRPDGAGGRVRIPVLALSKGERAKLRIAFVWAVRRLIKPERAANILVLDEADGGLDLLGLEAYGTLLDQLRGEYSSIFVVSHRKELSTVQFDQIWTVQKINGISTVSMERT